MTTWFKSRAALPSWLLWFGNDVARAIIDNESHAPIGCHYYCNEDQEEWEVAIFVSAIEVVGGARDGATLTCPVQLDVSNVIKSFDNPPQIHWYAAGTVVDEDVGPYVSFEGTARGHKIWLRFLAQAPVQAGPGRLLHAATGQLEDVW